MYVCIVDRVEEYTERKRVYSKCPPPLSSVTLFGYFLSVFLIQDKGFHILFDLITIQDVFVQMKNSRVHQRIQSL